MSGNSWHLASDWGILVKGDPQKPEAIFNTGRTNDALRLDDGTLLVASDTSGIWIADEAGNPATPLSRGWSKPNVRCMALGIRGLKHVYAGGEFLWETDITNSPMDIKKWREIPIHDAAGNPLNPGVIYDIVTVANDLIVLATDNGVFWASTATTLDPTYKFKPAVDRASNPVRGRFSAVAASHNSDTPVVAGAYGDGTNNHSGIFIGKKLTSELELSQAPISSAGGPITVVQTEMRRISLASCAGDKSQMFAAVGGPQDTAAGKDGMYCVLKSINGGSNWTLVGNGVSGQTKKLFGDGTDLAGGDQWYANCIAVSNIAPTASDPLKIAVGWQNGYFVSIDSGATWTMFKADLPGLHADFQGIVFDRIDTAQKTICLCTDGGLAISRDMGATHQTSCNRHFPNLQLYRIAHGDQNAGLLTVSLQDNGNQESQLYPLTTPWKSFQGGDGRLVAFLRNGQLLSYNNDSSGAIQEQRWNNSLSQFTSALGIIPLSGAASGGLNLIPDLITAARPWWGGVDQIWPLEAVITPTWRNTAHEALVAIAGAGSQVFGLFKGPTEKNLRWDPLGSFSPQPAETVCSVASNDGSIVLAGTSTGRIFSLAAGSPWTVTTMAITGVVTTPQIQQISMHSSTLAFAICSGNLVLMMSGTTWGPVNSPATFLSLPAEDYTGLETDWTGSFIGGAKPIFIASDSNVYTSVDKGSTWRLLNDGLPRTPHSVDIRFAREDSGATFLYLATYGWSVWRLLLNTVDGSPRDVTLSSGLSHVLEKHTFGDDEDDINIAPEIKRVSVLSPVAVMEFPHFFQDLALDVTVQIQYLIDDSVRITYKLHLKNNSSGLLADTTGVFVLPPGDTHTEAASVGLLGDLGSFTFTMIN